MNQCLLHKVWWKWHSCSCVCVMLYSVKFVKEAVGVKRRRRRGERVCRPENFDFFKFQNGALWFGFGVLTFLRGVESDPRPNFTVTSKGVPPTSCPRQIKHWCYIVAVPGERVSWWPRRYVTVQTQRTAGDGWRSARPAACLLHCGIVTGCTRGWLLVPREDTELQGVTTR